MPYRLLLLSLLLLGGCGQKGPLYLPARPAPLPPAETEPAEAASASEAAAVPGTQSSAPSPAAQPE
jgi:predicted small lipoprotein YifL